MNVKSILYIPLLFLFCQFSAYCQIGKESTVSVLPVSPEAASLQKFSEIPVSNYTGIPEISIPLHSIKKGDIFISVSLDYHSGGNKVDDIASRIGLGWALNSQAEITRSVRGLPDDNQFYADVEKYRNNEMGFQQRLDYLYNINQGLKDSEPDIYYLNLGNINCKIFKGSSGEWITMPMNENIRIEEGVDGYDWIITDGVGVKYKFKDREFTESSSTSISAMGVNSDGYNSSISSWLLTEVEDARGNKVNYIYESFIQNFLTKGGESISIPTTLSIDCNKSTKFNYSENTVLGKRIKSILYADGEIKFLAGGSSRLDLPGDTSLNSIEIYNKTEFVKRFKLFTSYFQNNTTGVNHPNIFKPMDELRLRLDSLREESVSNHLPAYKFEYYFQNGLPYRNSHAQDHWGFFNGADNVGTSVSYVEFDKRSGAKKKVNSEFAKETILTGITYPTGGKTEYSYEGNTYTSMQNIDGDESIIHLGGLTGTNNEPGATFDGLNYYYERSFVVTPEQVAGGPIRVTRHVDNSGFNSNCSCTIDVYLRKPDNSLIVIRINSTESFYITEPGIYTLMGYIQVEFSGINVVYFAVELYGEIQPIVGLNTYTGPGLRVKSIKRQFSSSDILTTIFDYNDPYTNLTSGNIGSLPNYNRNIIFKNQKTIDSEMNAIGFYNCECIVYGSGSNYTLINTRGSYIGYTVVSISDDINGTTGRTVYKYSYQNDINSESLFPFPPNSPQDWKRGLLLEESNYKKSGNSYIMVQRKINKYDVVPNSFRRSFGIKVGTQVVYNYPTGTNIIAADLQPYVYPIESDAYLLVADTMLTYTDTGQLKIVNNYTYSTSNFQLKQHVNLGSNGLEKKKEWFFASDYAQNAGSSTILQYMLANHLVNIPIEERHFSLNGNGQKLSEAIAYEFAFKSIPGQQTKAFYLKNLYQIDLNNINQLSNYDFITLPSHYYLKFTNEEINRFGKPVFQKRSGLQNSVYIYSYNGQYPIVEIKNADYTTVESILGGLENINTISSSNPSNDQVKNWIDQLRNSPLLQKAQITSYTYKPLVGMTSQTDAKGQTTYYEYDAFQRLKTIKDQNGNILKQTDYHYKN